MFEGRVSSYNINTFKGRIYLLEEYRPIPFRLHKNMRDPASIQMITDSLGTNANNRNGSGGVVRIAASRNESLSGRLKSLDVVGVGDRTIADNLDEGESEQ